MLNACILAPSKKKEDPHVGMLKAKATQLCFHQCQTRCITSHLHHTITLNACNTINNWVVPPLKGLAALIQCT